MLDVVRDLVEDSVKLLFHGVTFVVMRDVCLLVNWLFRVFVENLDDVVVL